MPDENNSPTQQFLNQMQRIPDEIGVAGFEIVGGRIDEEFLDILRGRKKLQYYQEMQENDSIVGAILFATGMMLKRVGWRIAPGALGSNVEEITEEQQWGATLFEGMLKDMEVPWADFVSDAISMLTFGFAPFELLFKIRGGMDQTSPKYKSLFNDGMVGIRKFAFRPQNTIDEWDIDEHGNVLGLYQNIPSGYVVKNRKGDVQRRKYIPAKCLLNFIPGRCKGSPEGRSALRNAVVPYYYRKRMQEIEAQAAERELNGFPVVRIPNKLLLSKDPTARALVASYKELARGLRYGTDTAVVAPSDTFRDAQGNVSNQRIVEIELLTSGGSRDINLDRTINRYSQEIARTILADFILIGSGDKGSFSLSQSKVDLFQISIEGFLANLAAPINDTVIPIIWKLNGLPMETMPQVIPGKVKPENISDVADFIQKMVSSGVITPDPMLENVVRELGGLPDKSNIAELVPT